jgi:hypothetical protein
MYVCMLWSVDSLPDNEVFGLEMLYPVSLPFAFSILRLLKGLQFVGLFVLLCFFFFLFFLSSRYICMYVVDGNWLPDDEVSGLQIFASSFIM